MTQDIDCFINSQKTLHSSPSWVSYRESCEYFGELCVMKRFDYIWYYMLNDFIQQWRRQLIPLPGIILCMRPANNRRRYIIKSSLIAWAHAQNDACFHMQCYPCWTINNCLWHYLNNLTYHNVMSCHALNCHCEASLPRKEDILNKNK